MANADSTSTPDWIFEPQPGTGAITQGELSAAQKVAHEIVIVGEPLNRSRFITGRRLNFPEHLGRLLRLRQQAIDAESQGRYVRADFLWKEAHFQLGKAVSSEADWEQLVTEVSHRLGLPEAVSPDQIRRHLVKELFLKVHWAFYNGLRSLSTEPGPKHRCFVHLNYICQIKRDCSELCFSNDAAWVADTQREIAALRAAEQWENAWWLARELVARFPDEDEYASLAADVQFSETFACLSGKDTAKASLKDAQTIQAGINRLDALRHYAPYNLFTLDLLAELHHLRAIKLANADKLSAALLALETAVAYNPGSEKLWKSREQVINMMSDLQSNMKKVLAEIKAAPNTSLTPKGVQMQREGTIGFSLMNEFADSEIPAQLKHTRQNALALIIWRQMSFPKPAAEDPRPFTLLTVMEKIAEQIPQSESQISTLWTQAAAEDPALAGLDTDTVISFLVNWLLKDATKAEPAPEPQVESQSEATQAAEPMIIPETDKKRFSLEPFMLWLFSRQAKWVKAELAFALVLICCVAVLGIREHHHRNVRDAAYQTILRASTQGDDISIIEKSEKFLSNSLMAPDSRQEEVEALYSESLVHWLLAQDPESDVARRHFERFLKLVPGRQ
jgi:hypothetical protein